MVSMAKEEIREAVRKRNASIARANDENTGLRKKVSCCGPQEILDEPSRANSCCGTSDIPVEKISEIMGYTKDDLSYTPEGANMGLGCGNPTAIASLQNGENVVDLGSGGGFDCFLAAKEVGETGKVIGVDMTPDMIQKARKNAEKAGVINLEFRLGEIEHIPVENNWADLIMSNCVINLSPDKTSVYKDAYRVLKPGGRVAISDILAVKQLPDNIRNDLELIGACIGGAETINETEKLLKEAGFDDIRITPKHISKELISEWFPGKSLEPLEYVVSAYIEAVKPLE